VDGSEEVGHEKKQRGNTKSGTSVLQTPPSKKQFNQQLPTPATTPPDKLVRKAAANADHGEEDQSDLIIVKRRKLKFETSASSNTTPPMNLKPSLTTTTTKPSPITTSSSEADAEEELHYKLLCIPSCIYTTTTSSLNTSTTTDSGEEEDITLICCDSCYTWQYTTCLGLSPEAHELPELFYCGECRPGWVEGLVREGKEGNGDIFVFTERGDGEWGVVDVVDGDDGEEDDDNAYSGQRTATITASAAAKGRIVKGKLLPAGKFYRSPSQPVPEALLPPSTKEQKKVKTYAQQYDELRALFAGSSRIGREEMAVLRRRDRDADIE